MYAVCRAAHLVLHMSIRPLRLADSGNSFVMMDCRRPVNETFLVDCFYNTYSKFILIVLKIYNITIKVTWLTFTLWTAKKIQAALLQFVNGIPDVRQCTAM